MREPSLRSAIAELPSRTRSVREYEVLRVAGTLVGSDASNCAATARNEVLKWAQKHCGGSLPETAWAFEEFEYFSGGRNTLATRIDTQASDIWALRTDDPDKNIAGRSWTTEVAIAVVAGQLGRFGARLLVSTHEVELDIEPHTPGFVRQIAENCGLVKGRYSIDAEPRHIRTASAAEELMADLIDPARPIPIFVVTIPEGASEPLINARALAYAVIGLAQVAVVSNEVATYLTEKLEIRRSVFGGAARAYLPGFSSAANPFDHRLILAGQLRTPRGAAQAARWMRSLAARESVRRSALGRDTLAFSAVRTASLELRQRRLASEGASETDLLAAARAQIASLEKELAAERSAQDFYASEHDKAEDRAAAAEEQARASAYRIQDLLERIKATGQEVDQAVPLPDRWDDFARWADVHLPGRVALTPGARRKTQNPEFEDVQLAARCLLWLATECRDRRIAGGEGSLDHEVVEPGVRHSHCGSDEFDFDWQGQKFTADWHIKSGGNTRDPKRCLRIYYGWDEGTQQIVIADMPAHRRNAAS